MLRVTRYSLLIRLEVSMVVVAVPLRTQAVIAVYGPLVEAPDMLQTSVEDSSH